MSNTTNKFWLGFTEPWGCYQLRNGKLWYHPMDKHEMPTQCECEKEITDTRGYEHIIARLEKEG
jgi:hypothetical protein